MKKQYVLGLMTIVALSACGKNLHLTETGQSDLENSRTAQMVKQSKEATAGAAKKGIVPLALNNQDGRLSSFSDLDFKGLILPYINAADPAHASQGVGIPAYAMQGSNEGVRFVKQSNLIFRAMAKIPGNREAVTGVKSIILKLRGMRVYTDGNTVKGTLSKQMLCMIDSKVCSGELQEDKANLNFGYAVKNDRFARLSNLNLIADKSVDEGTNPEGKLFITDIKSDAKDSTADVKTNAIIDSKMGAKVELASKKAKLQSELNEVSIDLKDLFELTDATAIDWIYANSVESSPNFRKFRMVIGNNVYVDSGELKIELSTDNQKLAKDYAASTLMNTDTSVLFQTGSILFAKELNSVKRMISNSLITVDDKGALDKNSTDLISRIAVALSSNIDLIQELRVVGLFDAVGKNTDVEKISRARTSAIAAQMVADGIVKEKVRTAISATNGSVGGYRILMVLSSELSTEQKVQIADKINKALDEVLKTDR